MAARNASTADKPSENNKSTPRPLPHCRTNTPAKTTRLLADRARPAKAGANAMATAGWASEITVEVTQNKAQAAAPACSPTNRMPDKVSRLTGSPKVMIRSTDSPRENSQGVNMPHDQKVQSMHRLMANRPVAASAAL